MFLYQLFREIRGDHTIGVKSRDKVYCLLEVIIWKYKTLDEEKIDWKVKTSETPEPIPEDFYIPNDKDALKAVELYLKSRLDEIFKT